MKRLNRYIAVQLGQVILITLVAMLAFFSFLSFLEEMSDIGTGNYTLWSAALYMLLSLPRLAYVLFPAVALIGALTGLGMMAGRGELTAMRAAGVSVTRIAMATMRVAIGLVLVAVLLGEVIAPISEAAALRLRAAAIYDRVTLATAHGFWARDGQSFVNVGGVLPDNQVRDVHVYEFDADNTLRVMTTAASGRYEENYWLLFDVQQTRLQALDDGGGSAWRSEVARLPSAKWFSPLDPGLVNIVTVAPESLSAWGLWRYIDYLQDNELNVNQHLYALWTKLMYPLATAVMVLLAVPFAFGSFRQMGIGQRILIGTLVGVAFHLLNQVAGHISQIYALNPAISAVVPTLLVLVPAVSLLRKVQ